MTDSNHSDLTQKEKNALKRKAELAKWLYLQGLERLELGDVSIVQRYHAEEWAREEAAAESERRAGRLRTMRNDRSGKTGTSKRTNLTYEELRKVQREAMDRYWRGVE